MQTRKLAAAIGALLFTTGLVAVSGPASANADLARMSEDDRNWVMQTKDYSATHFSKMTQINADNVKYLKPAWTFSTGTLHGHEGAPLVADGIMYVHTPFPNNVYAIDLNDPGKILWQYKPKQNPAARAVACCDVVNRGVAYVPAGDHGPAKIFLAQLDGNVVALNAKTGEEIWKVENSDITMGSTLTGAPFVAKDKVLVGSAGAELGVRGYVTAYNIKDGKQEWRAYATGPDSDLLLDPKVTIPSQVLHQSISAFFQEYHAELAFLSFCRNISPLPRPFRALRGRKSFSMNWTHRLYV